MNLATYPDSNNMTTGQRIRYYRKSIGLTQKELAQKIGITQSSIVLWENDKTTPVYNNLRALAEVLGMDVYSLCDEKTWENLKSKMPSAGENTLEALLNEELASKAMTYHAEKIVNEADALNLYEKYLTLTEENRKLKEDVAPIIPLYKQLNEKGRALCYALLESITKNPRYTDTLPEEAE